MDSLPETMQSALIPQLPASGYYIPNFISQEEEAYLLHKVIPLTLGLLLRLTIC